jgi:hypothetical protein
LQYYNPKNKEIIIKALKKAGRYDLIGKGEKCLVNADAPMNNRNKGASNKTKGGRNNYGKKKTKKIK